jgi:hypothetical protein
MMTQDNYLNALATFSDGWTISISGALINWSHLTGFTKLALKHSSYRKF